MADDFIRREDAPEILKQKQRDICPVGRCGHGYVYGRDRDEYDAIEADIDALENIPAADVKPVVHARWLPEYPVTHACSNCGFVAGDYKLSIFKFCPNCGAMMDGEG